jgi:hypothetical protein
LLKIIIIIIKGSLLGACGMLVILETASLLGFENDTIVREQPTYKVVLLFTLWVIEAPIVLFVTSKFVDFIFLVCSIIFTRARE